MKQPLSLLVAAVAATACAPAVPAGEFRIVGKIENVPDGAVVRLYEPQGQMLRGIGVDTLAGGRFSFRDTVAFPKVVQISVTVGDYRGGTLDVWVAPGKRIEVRGEDKQAWLWEAASDIAEQADEDMYRALVEPQICELNWFQDMLNTQQDFARYMELFGQVSEKTVRRMQTAPVTRVWLNKLAECARLLQFGIGTAHKAEMLALYDRMTEEQRQSPMGRRIDAYLNPAPAVGAGDRLGRRSVRCGWESASPGGIHREIYFARFLECGLRSVRTGDSRTARDRTKVCRQGCGCEHQPRPEAGVEGVYCRKTVGRKPMERTCRRRYRAWDALWGKGNSAFRVDRSRRPDSGCMAGLRQGEPAGKNGAKHQVIWTIFVWTSIFGQCGCSRPAVMPQMPCARTR